VSDARIFAVTGNPVIHSRSPFMFNACFEELQYPACYIRLAADSAFEALSHAAMLNLDGMNITSPFKEDMLSHVDHCDQAASMIGGINTVVWSAEQKTHGYNTDYLGVVNALRYASVNVAGSRCLVLGAGGAGMAAAYGLVCSGAQVTVVNRTQMKAQAVSERLGCSFADLNALETVLSATDILVSTLPYGVDIVHPSNLHPGLTVFDANYAQSTLVDRARNAGCTIVDPLGWLLYQAVPAFEYFLSEQAPIATMKEALHKKPAFKERSRIALIGFMGCGKTSIGQALAQKLGYDFVDMDAELELRHGMTIRQQFNTHGESWFREEEHGLLKELSARERVVISSGGGIVLRDENRALLDSHCICPWLFTTLETAVVRANDGTRPLLDTENLLDTAQALFDKRCFLYATTSDVVVVNEKKTISQMVDKLYAEINWAINS
jgi:shikimate dehydrogenase